MDRTTVIGVVQARMLSRRLPGKSLMKVAYGLSLMEMVLMRTLKAASLDLVVLATSSESKCDALESIATSLGAQVIRGEESDVLSRFVQAVRQHRPRAVVRVCADNPFIEPTAIDDLVEYFLAGDYHYADNRTPYSGLPDGFGCEIIDAQTLEGLDTRAQEASWREHVTSYIVEHPDRYRMGKVAPRLGQNDSDLRLDIDTAEDLERIRSICRELPQETCPYWSPAQIIAASRLVIGTTGAEGTR